MSETHIFSVTTNIFAVFCFLQEGIDEEKCFLKILKSLQYRESSTRNWRVKMFYRWPVEKITVSHVHQIKIDFWGKVKKFMWWLGPALGPRSAGGPEPCLGIHSNMTSDDILDVLEFSWTHLWPPGIIWKYLAKKKLPSQGPPGASEGSAWARANTWVLTFSSKINFSCMNTQKRLLSPDTCQFSSQKPHRGRRTLIFNFLRKKWILPFFY